MKILYIITFVIIIICLIFEMMFMFGKTRYELIIRSKLKKIIDSVCVICLAILGVLGCFEIYNYVFILSYLSVYALLKEIYNVFIVEKRSELVKINLQNKITKEVLFRDIFYEIERPQIKASKFLLLNKNNWIKNYCCDKDEIVSIMIEGKEHFFKFRQNDNAGNLSYIEKQLVNNICRIINIDDLLNLKILIVEDKNIQEKISGYFTPYNQSDLEKKIPLTINNTLFNLTFVRGFLSAISIYALITKWATFSIGSKIINFIIAIYFGIGFLAGIIIIIYEFIYVYGKVKSK